MNTTASMADKFIYLNETKIAIKDAIKAKGIEVTDDATFRSYADRILEIDGDVLKLPASEEVKF